MANKPDTGLEKVKAAIQRQGFHCDVLELQASTSTAVEAAQALGCKTEQIVKSLVLETKRSRTGVLILASGANRINLKKISTVVSEPVRMADAKFVREMTGFAIGGVPPLAHSQKMTAYIDNDLMEQNELWAAAGTPHSMFK
jgi:prolyl-tRNA editing enzyme YbaK/EbsC (Cys-tRNA(Pro) deacylase)